MWRRTGTRDRHPDPREVDLGLLPHEVADSADVSDSDPLDEPARSRAPTRLAVAGCLLAAAAVVATLVLAPGLGTLPEPAPGPGIPPPSPTLDVGSVPAEVEELIADERTHRLEMAGGLDGSVAVIWRELDGNPRYALVTRTADGTTTGQIVEAPFTLTAVPGGWVAMRAYRAYFLEATGALRDLPIQATTSPRSGDVLVAGSGRWFVYRPGAGSVAPAGLTEGADAAYLTGEGRLLTYDADRGMISTQGAGVPVTDDTGHVLFAGRDGTVAAAMLGDRPDGSIPLVGLTVSRDGGRSWESVALPDIEVEQVSSLVVLPDASVLLATPQQGLFRAGAGRLVHEATAPALLALAQTGTTATIGWDDNLDRHYVLEGVDPSGWKVVEGGSL